MLNKIKYMILMSISFMANAAEDAGKVDADYWTIEGMRSQEFSVGIFIFMIIGVAVFLGIIIHVIGSSSGKSKLKTGEKILLLSSLITPITV